jgi:diadenylate cyclase
VDFSFLPGIFASPWDILRNIIDIAIIAYVFYRLLRLIKGSRAEQLLKGLVILLVFSVAASLMQLEMVTWLLEKEVRNRKETSKSGALGKSTLLVQRS